MVEEWEDQTTTWMARRPSSVRCTFSAPEKDRPTQAPVILNLLRFTENFEYGFDMVGDVYIIYIYTYVSYVHILSLFAYITIYLYMRGI